MFFCDNLIIPFLSLIIWILSNKIDLPLIFYFRCFFNFIIDFSVICNSKNVIDSNYYNWEIVFLLDISTIITSESGITKFLHGIFKFLVLNTSYSFEYIHYFFKFTNSFWSIFISIGLFYIKFLLYFIIEICFLHINLSKFSVINYY
jgi:hypothetical protein